MTLLERYIAAATLRALVLVSAGLTSLFSLLEFVDQLHDGGDECGHDRADDQQQYRTDQTLPMRVAVQHHSFVGGEHVIRVTHDENSMGWPAADA